MLITNVISRVFFCSESTPIFYSLDLENSNIIHLIFIRCSEYVFILSLFSYIIRFVRRVSCHTCECDRAKKYVWFLLPDRLLLVRLKISNSKDFISFLTVKCVNGQFCMPPNGVWLIILSYCYHNKLYSKISTDRPTDRPTLLGQAYVTGTTHIFLFGLYSKNIRKTS